MADRGRVVAGTGLFVAGFAFVFVSSGALFGGLGSYLAANVIFTTIYGKPYQTACTLDFPAEQAEYIQRVAQQTVLENLTLLNIKR